VALIVTGIWWLVLKPGPSSPAPEPQRVTVLVADFQNLTGDPVFDGGLEQAVTIGLEQASFIDMYRRTEARKKAVQLDPKAGDRLDERLAQLVSRSEGVSVVVNGSIEKTQEGYKLKAWALDPVSSKKIVEQAKNISKKTEVNNEAVKLGGYLSSQIGGVPEESVQALSRETFTTSSVEAMKAYSHAQELSVLGKRQEAIKEYEKAVQEDPNFGRAYAGLAVIYQNSGQYQKAQEYQTKALSLIDRMTEREKYRTRGIWYLLTRNYKKAIEEYSALVEQFPADVAGTSNLALSYFFVRDMAKAVEYGKRRVELNPGETISHYNLSWYHLGAGNFELAEKESLKAMEINPKDEEAFISAALSNLARGNIDLATDYYLKSGPISTMTASLALMGLADIALYEGRLNDAVDILEKGIEADIENNRNDLADDKIVALAQSLLVQGKKDRALQLADKATAMSREADILFPAAQVYIRSGKEEKALALAAELAKKIEPEPQAYAKIIEAEVKKQRKNFREAIALLQEAQQLLDTWIGRFCLGCAYLEAGEFAGAHSEFELCLKRRGEAMSLFFNDLPSYSYLPAVYYYLGRAQEGLKSPAAKDSYQTFLKIKEKDQGDPLVADARKRIQF
jgi:tetratricopeptide (TPR) repeat protein